MKFSNPRREAIFEDWPSGNAKVRCRFWIEGAKRGERVCRQTTDKHGEPCKPKKKTYCLRACIIDGDDGLTYLLEHTTVGFITIGSHDMKHDVETVFYANDPERHAKLVALLQARQ